MRFLLLIALLSLPVAADLPITFGGLDPETQNWPAFETQKVSGSDGNGLLNSGGNVGRVSAAPEPGAFVWQINDQLSTDALNSPRYTITAASGDIEELFDSGFTLSFRVRAKRNHNTLYRGLPWAGGIVVSFGDALFSDNTNSTRRFFFPIAVGQNNGFQIFEEQDTENVVLLGPNSADEFHTIKVLKPPTTSIVRWYVDGTYAGNFDLALGTTTGGPNLISFGAGTSAGIGGAFDIRFLELDVLQPGDLRPLHVDADATGANDGSFWGDAFTSLQDALAIASAGLEIWVAEGTYNPDVVAGANTDDRASTFELIEGVAIYGGFDGTESQRAERDPVTHETILSGDLLQDDETTGTSDNSYTVVTGSGTPASRITDSTVLSGFTITAGNSDGNLILDPSAWFEGGGMHLSLAMPAITDCIFENNSAENGGALKFDTADPTISNCTFRNNSAFEGGGAIYNAGVEPSFINCAFHENSAFEGGGIYNFFATSPVITNCTVHANSATFGGGIFNQGSSPVLTNAIVWNNQEGGLTNTPGASVVSINSSSPTYASSLIENWKDGGPNSNDLGGTTNLDGTLPGNDPLFVAPASGDLRLQATSPTIDAGDSAANSTATDLAGAPRIAPFDTIDLGAYEYPKIDNFSLPNVYAPAIPGEQIVIENWGPDTSVFNDGSGLTYNLVLTSGNLAFDSFPFVGPGGTLSFAPIAGSTGWASFDVTISDPAGHLTPSSPIPVLLVSGVIHVDADASGANNGSSWNDAFTSLQDALASASDGLDIWVAEGTYYPDEGLGQTDNNRESTFNLIEGVALYGGFNGTETDRSERNHLTHETILSGDLHQNDEPEFANNEQNAYHVVTGDGSSSSITGATIFDGFTITAGNADHRLSPNNRGGGMNLRSASATITNCLFQGNNGGRGGAIYNSSSDPSLTTCSFQGNSASTNGGAIFNSNSSPSLSNCSLLDNRATSGGGGIANYGWSFPSLTNCSFQGNRADSHGGGMLNESDSAPSLTNCSFQGNRASTGGGIYNFDSFPTLTNCSFQGNRATRSGGAIYINDSSPSLTNCIVWNNAAGEGEASIEITKSTPIDSAPTFSHCLIENWADGGTNDLGGTDNLDGTLATNDPLFVLEVDPLFAPTTGGDLRLLSGSPALDAGDNAANTEPTDLAANTRIQNTTIDLGAYEGSFVNFEFLHSALSKTGDDNNNGVSNFAEYAAGLDPTASGNPPIVTLIPDVNSRQVMIRRRNNAADLTSQLNYSTTLLPGSWSALLEGPDYRITESADNGDQTIFTLELLRSDPTLFLREETTSP